MLDCLVIGGGHSGLMCAYLLGQAGVNCQVVDSSARVGDVWRSRPKNLRLFTSRQFCALADLTMQSDPNGYPLASEFADHLENFAKQKAIKVTLNSRVVRLSRTDECFVTELENGTRLFSKTVINATGSNQTPKCPDFSSELAPAVSQIAAKDFRDAQHLPSDSIVAVVGDGASGRQIAMELAPLHKVFMARGRRRKLVPNKLLGQDIFWWLNHIGVLFAGRNSMVAQLMKKRDPIPAALANDKSLAALGVKLKGRLVGALGDQLVFEDGSRESVDVVIWCAGYQESFEWIDLPSIQSVQCIDGHAGRTTEPGFFVVGRKWLTCRASELILGSERDAKVVVGYVLANLQPTVYKPDLVSTMPL